MITLHFQFAILLLLPVTIFNLILDVSVFDMFAELSLVKASVAKQYTNDCLNWAGLAAGYSNRDFC